MGERLVGFCVGALVCAVALNLAVGLMRAVLGWLIVGGLLLGLVGIYVWRIRRW